MKEHEYQILKRQRPWREAYYYQKSDTLYQLTYVFCQRFLPKHGDRTVDQIGDDDDIHEVGDPDRRQIIPRAAESIGD